MVMQIAALRHIAQEGQQKRRLVTDGFEIPGRALFGAWLGLSVGYLRTSAGRKGDQDQKNLVTQAVPPR